MKKIKPEYKVGDIVWYKNGPVLKQSTITGVEVWLDRETHKIARGVRYWFSNKNFIDDDEEIFKMYPLL